MIHTSPIGEEINDHYHWHIEIIPKLTKVAGLNGARAFTSIQHLRKNRRGSCAKQRFPRLRRKSRRWRKHRYRGMSEEFKQFAIL